MKNKNNYKLSSPATKAVKPETKMNIRIDPQELRLIKLKAEQEGLKYQTFVKSILHKYITGQLVDKEKIFFR
ncbi:MAG: antitoxin [bacterium]